MSASQTLRSNAAAVVYPTPGGAAGDGTVKGSLTVGVDAPNGTWVEGSYDSATAGMQNAALGAIASSPSYAILQSSAGDTYVNAAVGHSIQFKTNNGFAGLTLSGNPAIPTVFGNINCVANGLFPARGIDSRTSLTAVDGAALTVYAVPATTGKFRISATIVGRSGTVTSGIYTYIYTVGGVAITKTVSITAVDTDAENSLMPQPDASTSITAQLTTLTGTTPSVDVTTLVEGISSGT